MRYLCVSHVQNPLETKIFNSGLNVGLSCHLSHSRLSKTSADIRKWDRKLCKTGSGSQQKDLGWVSKCWVSKKQRESESLILAFLLGKEDTGYLLWLSSSGQDGPHHPAPVTSWDTEPCQELGRTNLRVEITLRSQQAIKKNIKIYS